MTLTWSSCLEFLTICWESLIARCIIFTGLNLLLCIKPCLSLGYKTETWYYIKHLNNDATLSQNCNDFVSFTYTWNCFLNNKEKTQARCWKGTRRRPEGMSERQYPGIGFLKKLPEGSCLHLSCSPLQSYAWNLSPWWRHSQSHQAAHCSLTRTNELHLSGSVQTLVSQALQSLSWTLQQTPLKACVVVFCLLSNNVPLLLHLLLKHHNHILLL